MSKHELGLRLIAIGKLVKVVTLVTIGIVALAAAGDDPGLLDMAERLGLNPGGRYVRWVLEKLAGVSTRHLEEAGFASFVYAAIFAVEGVGLWMKKRWAEYLTIVVTLSFVPLEIYEIVIHRSAAKVAMVVINVIVVLYLWLRVRWERRSRAPALLGTALR